MCKCVKINGVKKNINCNDVKNIESIFKNIHSHRLKQEIERVIRDPNSS